MFRLILALLIAVVYLILFLPVELVLFLLGKKDGWLARARYTRPIIQWIFRVLLWVCGIKVTVKGLENIPDEPVLYVANHQSLFDILVAYTQMPQATGFISKKEVDRIPLLRDWMRFIGCLFLDRKDPRSGLQMIIDAIGRVQAGLSIFVFPEGTRRPAEDGGMQEFHEGTMKIASKSGCPVVPVAITGTRKCFEAHLPWVRAGHATITFGKPFRVADLEKPLQRHSGAYARERIQELLGEDTGK